MGTQLFVLIAQIMVQGMPVARSPRPDRGNRRALRYFVLVLSGLNFMQANPFVLRISD